MATVFSGPTQWWGKRQAHRHTDFKHKKSKAALWPDKRHKPGWVAPQLALLEAGRNLWAVQRQGLRQDYLDGGMCRKVFENGRNTDSVDALNLLVQQGCRKIPNNLFYRVLKVCIARKDLGLGRRIHTLTIKNGLDGDSFLATHLIGLYASHGRLDEAMRVFTKVSTPDAYNWAAIILAYARHGEAAQAIRLYGQMLESTVKPDNRTYTAVLKACSIAGDLGVGKAVHAQIIARLEGFQSDVFVATSLVDMYGKCGMVVDARKVFDGLSDRNVVSWNVMLAAYAQHGQAQETLELYRLMQEEGVTPSSRTMVSVLQGCSMLAEDEMHVVVKGFSKPKSLEKGKALHAYCRRKGFDLDSFVSCALITMYGKCGSIYDAEVVFSELSLWDVVAWTSLVTAYVEQGQPEKGLQLYMRMQLEGVAADTQMFVSALKACSLLAVMEEPALVDSQPMKLQALEYVKAIHAEVWKKSHISDAFVGITLLNTYGKCWSIVDGQNVFDGLCQRSLVAWTALLAIYVEQGQAENALQLYHKMQEEGVSADTWTFGTLLQACGMLAEKEATVALDGQRIKLTVLQKVKAIEAESRRLGCGADISISTNLISMYGKCGGLADAENLFQSLSHRSVVVWNALVSAYLVQGLGDKALQLYVQMQEEGVSPDDRTFVSMLQACSLLAGKEEGMVNRVSTETQLLRKGRAMHCDICRKGFQSDVFVGSSLITMYGKCGSIQDAQRVFDELPTRDLGTWNAMLAAYVVHDQGDKALQLYKQMRREGMLPNEITLVCVLQACGSTGSLDVCRQIHHSLVPTGSILSNVVASTLMHAYGRCSSMVDAQAVFEALPEPNVVSWTALLAGYAREGDDASTFQCYEDMLRAGVKPNKITFLALVSACSHAGLVDRGIQYFESMVKDHGITPEIEHYISMVDLLGRAGYFTRLSELLLTMTVQPSLAVWLCVLGACRMHGRVVLGRQAFDRAVGLQPQHSAAYVLMWNIYADVSNWECANEVHEMRLQAGAWKKPGQCWIEHERESHAFVVSNLENQEKDKLNDLLTKISLHQSRGGDPCGFVGSIV